MSIPMDRPTSEIPMLWTVVVRADSKGAALAPPKGQQPPPPLASNSTVSLQWAVVVALGLAVATSFLCWLASGQSYSDLLVVPGLSKDIFSIKVAWALGLGAISLLWVATILDTRKGNQHFEWVVEISYIGIQLYQPTDSPLRGPTPTVFIAQSDVLDCIVYEVIQVACVRSIVSLRVRNCDPRAAVEINSSTSPAAAARSLPPDYRIIPLFQGVHLTYSECMQVRNEIQKHLRSVSLRRVS
jgi:hypothetical protein